MIDLKILNESYQHTKDHQGEMSRLEFLSDYIFDFTTYESDAAELFATKALEVCRAISDGATFKYIADDDGHIWYLLMVNMPFFKERLEWGTSVRGAWWRHGLQSLDTCGIFVGDEQKTAWTLSDDEWRQFIEALIEFGLGTPA